MNLFEKFKAAAPPLEPVPRTILESLGGGSRNVESFSASGREVGTSRDLARVLELPRRSRPTVMTTFEHLKNPRGPCKCRSKFSRACATELRPTQGWALSEIASQGGLLGPIAVGDGKTLLDLLAAMVVKNCKVAVLLIPPQLKSQMLLVDWEFYGQHWRLPNLGSGSWFEAGRPTLHIIAYSELSSAKNANALERIRPDLIIADEAHLLRNAGTARTKRFRRYFTAHPETRFCCWSGTLTTKSIKDYAHLAALALGEGSPCPLHWPTVEEWAGAIDPSDWPTGIGALRALCTEGEHIRAGYRRRLEDTPGVVSSPATMSCTASLIFSERKTVATKPVLDALHALQTTWTRPDGEELVTALEVHRCAKEISAGFYYRWRWPRAEPEPVRKEWLRVRKEWHREMREKLKQSKEFLDSPLLLAKAAIRWYDGYVHVEKRGGHQHTEHCFEWRCQHEPDEEHDHDCQEIRICKLPEGEVRTEVPPGTKHGPEPVWPSEVWPEWKVTRNTAQPETEGVWIDDWLARDAADWCREGAGICWYEHDLFGRRVAELGDQPLYGPGNDAGVRLLSEDGKRAIVASIRAHGTGKNLQQFARNLVANQFSDAATAEQLVGRTHRLGQLADQVTVEVYRHTSVVIDALNRARMLAEYIQGTMGGSQKLLKAQYLF